VLTFLHRHTVWGKGYSHPPKDIPPQDNIYNEILQKQNYTQAENKTKQMF
jgi:hypothetical protein